jgi:hypothetical protein
MLQTSPPPPPNVDAAAAATAATTNASANTTTPGGTPVAAIGGNISGTNQVCSSWSGQQTAELRQFCRLATQLPIKLGHECRFGCSVPPTRAAPVPPMVPQDPTTPQGKRATCQCCPPTPGLLTLLLNGTVCRRQAYSLVRSSTHTCEYAQDTTI